MKAGLMCATVLMALGTLGCAGSDGDWAGTMTDSAGVMIVANTAESLWGSSGGWALEEELKIGSIEGDPDYQFGMVGFIAVDSDGRIYVLDAQAQHIQVYSPDGTYEQTLGGRGGGPGELQGAMFVLMGPGDTLLVPDLQNMRINRYAPDGSSLGSFPVKLEDGIPAMFRATPSGVMAEQVRQISLPGQEALENPMDRIVLLTPDGVVTDTLKTFPSGETFKLSGGAPEFNIYSPEYAWDLTDDLDLFFAINDQYRIEVYDTDGQLKRVVTMPFERKPVGERDRDAIIGFMERAWRDAGVPAQVLDQLKQNIHFGEYFPAFSTILAGPHSTMWVQHIQAASDLSEGEYASFNPLEDSGAPEWDVFDEDGRFMGVITMPHRFAPRVIKNNLIYGVWRDELDVQYVVRLRVIELST
jgi:hypothetical protein